MSGFNLKNKDPKFLSAVLALFVIGIALISSWGGNEKKTADPPEDEISQNMESVSAGRYSSLDDLEISLEKRLESTLSQIKGAGQVDVTVFLATGPKYEYAVNVTTNERSINERDQSGGTRVTTETTEDGQLVVIRSEPSGGEAPVVAREYKPEVQGVLVVAEGADNPKIKARLISAVQTALDLETHKIDVQLKE